MLVNRAMGRVRQRTSTKRAPRRGLTGWLRGLPPQFLCKDVIPWEFPLLFSQGYDSAAFSAAAWMAGMMMGAVRRQLLHGLPVEPAPVLNGLQVEPAPVLHGLQVEPAPV